jgi:Domain of unknown function (DUF4389)
VSETQPPDERTPPDEPTPSDETPPAEPTPPSEPTQPDERASAEGRPADEIQPAAEGAPEPEATTPVIEPPRPHAVRLLDGDDRVRSRLTVLVRIFLVLPHLIWLGLYTLVAIPVTIVNWFATLIKGRSPERIHRWLVRYLRYTVFVYSYLYLLANPYPPFHGTAESYPVDLVVEGPDPQHRLVTAFRIILAIPAGVLNWVFSQVLQIVALLGWFVAIVIGRMPNGMDKLGLYCLRYQAQTTAYLSILTDRYPSLTA